MEGEAAVVTLLADATALLAGNGVEQPRREARLLLGLALGLSADAVLRLAPGALVPAAPFRALVARRALDRAPLAHLAGTRGFWTLELAVSPATLIPRGDTESLVEAAIAANPDRRRVRRILDLGTGTGALLLACLAEFPDAFGVGVDLVGDACRLARRNAHETGLWARAAIVRGNWAASLAPAAEARFDLVLCNPPYIEAAALSGLMPEVARHEPASALDGGEDGLDGYRAVLPQIASLLAADGLAVLELGYGQAAAVAPLAAASGLAVAGLREDLGGTPRAMLIHHAARADDGNPAAA